MSAYAKIDKILDETTDRVINNEYSLAKGRVIATLVNGRINAAIVQCYLAAAKNPQAIGFQNDSTLQLDSSNDLAEKE